MSKMIAEATEGLPAGAQKIAKHLIAKAKSLPSLAAMKTTKLQDADCANKDVYTMILGEDACVRGVEVRAGAHAAGG